MTKPPEPVVTGELTTPATQAVRYHRKRDGILRIEQDGRARFLTLFERIRYFFGAKP